MLKKEYKKKLIEIIKKHLPKCKIYLYGSRSRGDHSMGSDIDLALDTGDKIDTLIIAKIKDDIENSTIPLFTDIIDLNNISQEFKAQITPELLLLKS
jgi:predicted nucleotidyltransferase